MKIRINQILKHNKYNAFVNWYQTLIFTCVSMISNTNIEYLHWIFVIFSTRKRAFSDLVHRIKCYYLWIWYTIIQLPIHFHWMKWIEELVMDRTIFQYLQSLMQYVDVFSFGLLKAKKDYLTVETTIENFTEAKCKLNFDTNLSHFLAHITERNN